MTAFPIAQSANVKEKLCVFPAQSMIKKYEPIAARNTHTTSANANSQRRKADFFTSLQFFAIFFPISTFLMGL